MKSYLLFSSLLITLAAEAAYNDTTTQNQKKTQIQSAMSSQSQTDRYTTKEDERLAYHLRRQISQIAPQFHDFILYIDKGDVKIMGSVPSEDVKIRIIDALKQVKGVRSVTNRLETGA